LNTCFGAGRQLVEHQKSCVSWYDYGFRFYDPALGRFTCLDPIADEFAHVSPYNYAENRPINGIDLWGLQFYPTYSSRLGMEQANQSQALFGREPLYSKSGLEIGTKVDKGIAKTGSIALSFAVPITRLGYLGYAAATVKGFNTSLAAAEVIAIQIPLLMKATSDVIGGGIEGNTLPTQLLYEADMDKTAATVDLAIDVTSLVKDANLESAEEVVSFINGIFGTIEDANKAYEEYSETNNNDAQSTTNQNTNEENEEDKK
jgi:RHS repeat-associated protein